MKRCRSSATERPAPIVRDRLELRGYTLELAKSAFERSLRYEAAKYEEWSEHEHGAVFKPFAQLLASTSVDSWLTALHEIRSKGLKQRDLGGDPSPYEGTLIGYMLSHDWYGYPGPDLNVGLRLAHRGMRREQQVDLPCIRSGAERIHIGGRGFGSVRSRPFVLRLLLKRKDYCSDRGRTDCWIISQVAASLSASRRLFHFYGF